MTEEAYSENKIDYDLMASNKVADICQQSIKYVSVNVEKAIQSYLKSLKLNSVNESWDNIYYPLVIMKHIKKKEDFLLDYFKNEEFNSIRFSILKYKLNFGEKNSNDYFNSAIKTIEDNTNSYIENTKYNIENLGKKQTYQKK